MGPAKDKDKDKDRDKDKDKVAKHLERVVEMLGSAERHFRGCLGKCFGRRAVAGLVKALGFGVEVDAKDFVRLVNM